MTPIVTKKLLQAPVLRFFLAAVAILATVVCVYVGRAGKHAFVIPEGIEMISLSHQSWDASGWARTSRLWRDGRSEVIVVDRDVEKNYPGPRTVSFTEDGIVPRLEVVTFSEPLSREEAKARFQAALEAGITELKTFKPDYVDGSGCEVGVQIDGRLIETVIPEFMGSTKGTENHRRFIAVSRIMSFPKRTDGDK